MPQYLLYFNQQWVGDHTGEWFRGRGPLARAVVEDMKQAGVYVAAGGLEEDGPVYHAAPTGPEPAADDPAEVMVSDGPYAETTEWIGGFAIVDVPDDETATQWAARVAAGCGWPHEVRRFS